MKERCLKCRSFEHLTQEFPIIILMQKLKDIEIKISQLKRDQQSYVHCTKVYNNEKIPTKKTLKIGVAKIMDICMTKFNLTQPNYNSQYINLEASQHVTTTTSCHIILVHKKIKKH